MFKKSKILISLFIVISLLVPSSYVNVVNAATKSKAPATQGTEVAKKQTKVFMWEVTSKTNKSKTNKVYILGSVHFGEESIYPLDKRIEGSFKKADNLVVEADIVNANPAAIQQSMLKLGTYEGDETIKDNISEELYKKLEEKVAGYASFQVNMQMLEKGKPWLLTLQLAALDTMKSGYKAEEGIDMHFLKQAGKKKIIELESADFQFRMLSSFSDKLQAQQLEEALKQKDETGAKNTIDTIFKYWKTGDAKGLEKMMIPDLSKASDEIKEYYNKMFFWRNAGMEKKIEGYLKDNKSYFVVVGAGHLVGQKGVIELLKKKGYTVKQL